MDLPVSFADRTRSLLGDEEYNKLADALNDEQPVSIRLNEEKLPGSSFSLFHASSDRVPWSATGCYLDRRLTFTFDPLFHVMLLCTGSIFHVCGAGIKAIYRRKTLRNA